MKAQQVKDTVTPFKPVKIELIFESQRELDAYGTMFNHCAFHDVVYQVFGFYPPAMHDVMRDAGADIDRDFKKVAEALNNYFNRTHNTFKRQ